MTKSEFLKELYEGLIGLPEKEIEERIAFYSEMIDDKIEDGFSEEDAIKQIGNPKEIVKQIIAEYPFSKLIKQKIKPKKRLSVLAIILIILGSPIWLSLGIALFAVILAVNVCLWAVILVIWAVFGALIILAFAFLVVGILELILGSRLFGLLLISVALVLAGVSIIFFFVCKYATKGMALLTKFMGIGFKRLLFRRAR